MFVSLFFMYLLGIFSIKTISEGGNQLGFLLKPFYWGLICNAIYYTVQLYRFQNFSLVSHQNVTNFKEKPLFLIVSAENICVGSRKSQTQKKVLPWSTSTAKRSHIPKTPGRHTCLVGGGCAGGGGGSCGLAKRGLTWGGSLGGGSGSGLSERGKAFKMDANKYDSRKLRKKRLAEVRIRMRQE